MTYIEREKAIKVANQYGCTSGATLGTHSGLADFIADEIAKIPAANVAPLQHGCRNYSSNVFGSCSLCGAWYVVLQGTDDREFLYCPTCGCKINLGELIK